MFRDMKAAGNMKSDRRLSLPVNDRRLEYKDRLRMHPSTSTVGEAKTDRDPKKDDSDDEQKSETPVLFRRRRIYSTSDADLGIPEIVIDEAPPAGSGSDAGASHAAVKRLTFRMDHLRIGDVLADHINEKQQKTAAAILKRQELANEQIAKPSSSPPPGNRRRSVPNLKSVVEEEDTTE